ncbi:MAG: hypothetical protein J1F64_00375, partial [Oscillospiraceae bacterium]|nr:hypothetical protein [Oscillospiraceae bacterium]
MERIVLKPNEEHTGERIDKYISSVCDDISRSYAAKLAENGHILLKEKAVDKKYKIKRGDEIAIDLPEPEILDAVPENIPLDIVYEDANKADTSPQNN